MVSSKPFDVLEALGAGMRTAWIRRSPEAICDPWGPAPTLTVPDLSVLGDRVARVIGD